MCLSRSSSSSSIVSFLVHLLVWRDHCQSFGEQEIHPDRLHERVANVAVPMQTLHVYEVSEWNIFNRPELTPTGVRNERSLIRCSTIQDNTIIPGLVKGWFCGLE